MDVPLALRTGRQLTLRNQDDRATIENAREKHANFRVRGRLTVLWYKYLGQTNELIGELVGYSSRQVLRILQLYARQGLQGVMTFGERGRPGATDEYRELIKQDLTAHPVATVDRARRRIEELTGVSLKRPRARDVLHSLGFSWRKTAAIPVPPKMSLDDHLVLGAIDPIHRTLIDVTSANTRASQKYVNTQTVCELLERIRVQHPTEKISLVLDNASYQRNDTVRAKADELDILLEFLPSYSPNLNLIERLWRLIRAEALPT